MGSNLEINPSRPNNYRIYSAIRPDPTFKVRLFHPVTLQRRHGPGELLLKPGEHVFKGTVQAERGNRWTAVYMHNGWSYGIVWSDLMHNGELV